MLREILRENTLNDVETNLSNNRMCMNTYLPSNESTVNYSHHLTILCFYMYL